MTPNEFQQAMKTYLDDNGYPAVLVETDYTAQDWSKERDRTIAENHMTIIISWSAGRPKRRSHMITSVWDIICIINERHSADLSPAVALPVFDKLLNNPEWNYASVDMASNIERDISDNNYIVYAGGLEATLGMDC